MTRGSLGSLDGALDIAGTWGRNMPPPWALTQGASLPYCLGSILDNQQEEKYIATPLNDGELTRTFSYFLIGNTHFQMTPSSSPPCPRKLEKSTCLPREIHVPSLKF